MGGVSVGGGGVGGAPGVNVIQAQAPLWRCSRIMHLLRDLHPTLLSALEGIVDQVKIAWSLTIHRALLYIYTVSAGF